MGGLIVRRLVLAAFVVWGVTLITFFLSHVVPGDPARLIAGPRASLAAIAHIRAEYGLDRPLPQQYVGYMAGLVRGNLGVSFVSRRPVSTDLLSYFPATLELTLYALVFGSLLAVLAALLSVRRRGTATETGVQLLSVTTLSVPAFWAALILQLVVAVALGWLPGGIFVVDHLFAGPGIGAYAFSAFQASDYNAVMGVTLLVGVLYVLVNLAVDLTYLYLDPRIRYT